MPNKLTYQYIKKSFEADGFMLLSDEYVNAHTQLKYLCPDGIVRSITWNNWKKGYRHINRPITEKLTYQYIKECVENRGYKLISDRYINSNIKITVECSIGHVYNVTFHNFKKGSKCPYCYGNVKYEFDIVNEYFKKYGYRMISKEYLGANYKLETICPEGHIYKVSFSCFKNAAARCGICYKNNMGGNNHPNWKGGISKEPYCQDWTKDLKEFVKQRDGYKCMNPYCTAKNPYDLVIHHINYNKKSCGPENLITLCRSCNAKANADRNWHEAWYKAILIRRYGYKY